MLPESTTNVPAMALSNVDLPEPFVPITITNDPSSIVRSTPCRDRTSFGVPALKVLARFLVSSIDWYPGSLRAELREQVGQDQRQEYEHGSDQLKIVRIESPAQCDRHQEPEKHRAHHRASDGKTELSRPNQRFSDDHAGQTP